MKLTAKATSALALPPGKTDHIEWDDEMPGFGFRVRLGTGGKLLKSWIVQYRRVGQTRRLLLGSAAVLGAEQARLLAKKALGAVAMGEDPQADRRTRRGKDQLSMRSQVAEFLAAKEPELADRTMSEVKRYSTDPRYFGPLFNLPIDTITRRDVAARVVVIARERGAATAARARGTLSSFFTWCMRMGIADNNPTIGAIRPQENAARDRVLSDDELARIWKACGDDEYGKVVKLLILTACRRGEIGDMRWSEIDLERSTFTIPAARSKNGKPHTLPLLVATREIVESVPRMASRDQLFGMRSHGFTRWPQGKRELDARAGVSVPWTIHDLRRTTATGLANLGTPPHVVEAILNHQSGSKRGVAGVYNKSVYEREVRAALGMWEDHIRALVEGGKRRVVAFAPQTAS
jgi:integrase